MCFPSFIPSNVDIVAPSVFTSLSQCFIGDADPHKSSSSKSSFFSFFLSFFHTTLSSFRTSPSSQRAPIARLRPQLRTAAARRSAQIDPSSVAAPFILPLSSPRRSFFLSRRRAVHSSSLVAAPFILPLSSPRRSFFLSRRRAVHSSSLVAAPFIL
eukprot:Selendium_serpulae@DN8328_c0_g1_i1.p1